LDRHQFNLGGLPLEYSLSKISEYLESFFTDQFSLLPCDDVRTIKDTMNIIHPLAEISTDAILDRIQTGKPYAMVVTAAEHAVGIVFDKDKINVCNRGFGHRLGSMEHAIEILSYHPSKLTKGVIDSLKSPFHTIHSLFELLKSLNMRHLEGIPQKDQDADNCSWITSKSVLHAVLYAVLKNHLSYEIYKEFSEYTKTVSYKSYLRSSLQPDHCLIQAIKNEQMEKKEADFVANLLCNL
jgi:hypothetical protein